METDLAIADFGAVDFLLARASSGVTFGVRKVFLGSLGIDWTNEANLRTLRALVRDGLIQLSRADLVAAMDPSLVATSEVTSECGRAVWHFLVVG